MHLTADLHIHSHYSRATSKDLNFFHLALWGQLKGVNLLGTGDIAHPGWLAEMRENLEPAEPGLYQLKPDLAKAVQAVVPPSCQGAMRFILAGEISSIYKKGEKTRKVHNVIFAPSLETVAKIQVALEKIGNIRSDGRPILGLPSRDLLEIILTVDERCHLIPAHIWTPWFSLLGSKSGYDSVEACFEDLSPHIFALETGLSSDPPMNWRVSNLDRYTLVSSSDAHSPAKLAREATLLDCKLSYDAIFDALKSGDKTACRGTLEFFPEEGKYHHDGHRKCGINWKPATTIAHNGLCTVCGKPVTVGVYHRVEELADRPEGIPKPQAHPYYSLIPLPEILSELLEVGPNSKRVQGDYHRLLSALGSELNILFSQPLAALAAAGGERLAEGIDRMRRGDINATAGYDGDYGVIKLFAASPAAIPQLALFSNDLVSKTSEPRSDQVEAGDQPVSPALSPMEEQPSLPLTPGTAVSQPGLLRDDLARLLAELNEAQRSAVTMTEQDLIIAAGPGTGKTRTLTTRIAYLVQVLSVKPESLLAITFTNKAAEEMRERLRAMLGDGVASQLTIKTFHAFGAMLLRQYGRSVGIDRNFVILSDDDRTHLLRGLLLDLSRQDLTRALAYIAATKNQIPESQPTDLPLAAIYQTYQETLQHHHALDYDDLVGRTVDLLESQPQVLAEIQKRYRWISVDEYQDVNPVQYRLLRLLTSGGSNLCVIGDPDQAIYGFRGADHRFFLRFTQDYPSATHLQLSQNYRSSQEILDAAQQVIVHNADREATEIVSDFVTRVKIDIHPASTDRAEAEFVIHQIEQMVGGTSHFSLDSGRVTDQDPSGSYSFGDFAVLYRLNALAHSLTEAFIRSGIPFQAASHTGLNERPEVKRAFALLWLLKDPTSRIHQDTLATIPETLATMTREVGQQPVTKLMMWAAKTVGLDETIRDRLVQQAQPFGHDLMAYLETMILGNETDAYDQKADRVALMTLHAAKGLEFPVVFIIGCEDGLLPYRRPQEAPNLNEERRLFYVGMTRAQKKLILTHTHKRFLYGQRLEMPVSPFVQDIETALTDLRTSDWSRRKRRESGQEQLSLF